MNRNWDKPFAFYVPLGNKKYNYEQGIKAYPNIFEDHQKWEFSNIRHISGSHIVRDFEALIPKKLTPEEEEQMKKQALIKKMNENIYKLEQRNYSYTQNDVLFIVEITYTFPTKKVVQTPKKGTQTPKKAPQTPKKAPQTPKNDSKLIGLIYDSQEITIENWDKPIAFCLPLGQSHDMFDLYTYENGIKVFPNIFNDYQQWRFQTINYTPNNQNLVRRIFPFVTRFCHSSKPVSTKEETEEEIKRNVLQILNRRKYEITVDKNTDVSVYFIYKDELIRLIPIFMTIPFSLCDFLNIVISCTEKPRSDPYKVRAVLYRSFIIPRHSHGQSFHAHIRDILFFKSAKQLVHACKNAFVRADRRNCHKTLYANIRKL